VVDLDLRLPGGRARFEELVRRSDLVVHSFSRRVMPNLGYGPSELQALDPDVATLAITAFPDACAQRDWVAYGSGVHAISGLGMLDGRPTPAPVAYPDPLAGVAAFAVALSLLGRHDPGARQPCHAEVSLAGVVAPLVPATAAAGVGA
jgi:crotonobetainyl-CoA:carnitine CoA-transferase CaiB-like acyl-CoA transferase